MLYPQTNRLRTVLSLDGAWAFAKDEDNNGESKGWYHQVPADRQIAVPASWNEQCQDLMHFFETGWYEKEIELPYSWEGQQVFLRVGAANYLTKVWMNGEFVGEHEGAHLPFAFNVTSQLRFGEKNRIVISVYVRIKPDSLPPGEVEHEQIIQKYGDRGQFPRNYYDFFPYGGIHRSVCLYSVSSTHIDDIGIQTDMIDDYGLIRYELKLNQPFSGKAHIKIAGIYQEVDFLDTHFYSGKIEVPHPRCWSPEDPHLYELDVELIHDGTAIDYYVQKVGIRTIRIEGGQLLLNGQPIFLKGFGMHEDFAVLGKGMHHAVIAKDIHLLKWSGANSMRTSHYPYSEEFLQYADEHGILVIGETPFVGFVRGLYNDVIAEKAKRVITEMITRDRNHPSIIAWSLANEPDSFVEEADAFFKGLYDHAKLLDHTRPITLVNCLSVEGDVALQHFDFVSLNRYYGWYTLPNLMEENDELLSAELDRCYELFGKPVMITEFGADAIAGIHMDPPELFSEEYQADMITRQYRIMRNKPFVIGAHVWAFADFKTSQNFTRVVFNRKGLFTRDRQPKLAAHRIREIWSEED